LLLTVIVLLVTAALNVVSVPKQPVIMAGGEERLLCASL
jgi:hypothetical protein